MTELLHKFFANKASDEQIEQVLNWIDSSPENYQTYLEERKVYDMIILSESHIRQKERSNYSAIRRIGVFALKYAAIILVVVGFSTFIHQRRVDNLLSHTTTLTTPQGQRLMLTLPDGTNVEMNSESTIEYQTMFSDKQRVVKLDGEVYFDVKHDPKRPFIVETDLCQVEVLGTVFNVEAYGGEDFVKTSLREGSVKITEIVSGKNIIISPQQSATVNDNQIIVEQINDDNYDLWRRGIFSFEKENLASIISELNRVYGVTITVDESFIIPNKVFTGKIRVSKGINHAMSILQKIASFNYTNSAANENLFTIH